LIIRLSSRDVTAGYSTPVRINNNIVMCEYARTEKDRQNGLQGIRFMPHNQGMLFDTFGRYRPIFHMRNVFIPLEAVFISTVNKIVEVVPMMPLDASRVYTTHKNIPIKWVLELNQGYCNSHGIKTEDLVYLD